MTGPTPKKDSNAKYEKVGEGACSNKDGKPVANKEEMGPFKSELWSKPVEIELGNTWMTNN